MTIGASREIEIISIAIGDHEYQLPGEVVRALKNLEKELSQEKRSHEKTKAMLQESKSDDFEIITSRILYNLEYDNPTIVKKQGFTLNTGKTNDYYQPGQRCLAYSLDDFEYKGGATKFTFRDECKRRIILALNGKTVNGLTFKDAR